MNRRSSAERRLSREPYRFEFFQAVRLAEMLARRGQVDKASTNHAAGDLAIAPIGEEGPPDSEAVRFRTHVSQAFPAGSIVSMREETSGADGRQQRHLQVAFMGLIGQRGVLPLHYTSLVIARCHPRNRDFALRDFLDIFNHRLISLFFRVWQKHRLPFAYEKSFHQDRGQDDLFTFALYSIVGMGTPRLRRRLSFHDETQLYYAGHFSHHPKSAVALELLLNDYLKQPVQVLQFQGQWLELSIEDQTSLPDARGRTGSNFALGSTALAGRRVWSTQQKFRVQIGPVSLAEFQSYFPNRERLRELSDLVRQYVGADLDFDFQILLRAADVPKSLAGQSTALGATRLGWNSWATSNGRATDADDAVFASVESMAVSVQ